MQTMHSESNSSEQSTWKRFRPAPIKHRVELSALEITFKTEGVTSAWMVRACQVTLVFL